MEDDKVIFGSVDFLKVHAVSSHPHFVCCPALLQNGCQTANGSKMPLYSPQIGFRFWVQFRSFEETRPLTGLIATVQIQMQK